MDCDKCNNCDKTKNRTDKEYKALVSRLNRIEGQVRGVKGMLDGNAYCVDILTQVSAISAALNSFSRMLLDSHIRTCVVNDIKNGDETVVDELIETVNRFMK